MRCVDFAVAYGEVFAAVDVESVAVGINHHIIYGTQFASCKYDAEVTAPVDGDITDQDVAALLEGNSLIARTDISTLQFSAFFCISPGESFAVNHSSSGD